MSNQPSCSFSKSKILFFKNEGLDIQQRDKNTLLLLLLCSPARTHEIAALVRRPNMSPLSHHTGSHILTLGMVNTECVSEVGIHSSRT